MRFGWLVLIFVGFAGEALGQDHGALDRCFAALIVPKFQQSARNANWRMEARVNGKSFIWDGKVMSVVQNDRSVGLPRTVPVWRAEGRMNNSVPSQDIEEAKRKMIQSSPYFTAEEVVRVNLAHSDALAMYDACGDLDDLKVLRPDGQLEKASVGERSREALKQRGQVRPSSQSSHGQARP